jgi:hypothetical protein
MKHKKANFKVKWEKIAGYLVGIIVIGILLQVNASNTAIENDNINAPEQFIQSSADGDGELWNKTWNEYSHMDARKVWANETDVYTTGIIEENGRKDIFLNRYDAQGNLLWSQIFGGPGHEDSSDVWSNGTDIYVVGSTNSYRHDGFSVLLLKYNSAGDLIWNKSWGALNAHQCGYGIYGQGEFIYITGSYIFMVGMPTELLLMRWNATGDVQWWHTWSGSDRDYGIAIHGDENYLYTVGYSEPVVGGQKDICIVKWSIGGALQWGKTWGSNLDEYGNDVWIQDGCAYVVGDSRHLTNVAYLVKWDASGNEVWNRTFGNHLTANSIWGDGEFLYVTGSSIVSKWNADGCRQWYRFTSYFPTGGCGIYGVGDSIYTIGTHTDYKINLAKWDKINHAPTLVSRPLYLRQALGTPNILFDWVLYDLDVNDTYYSVFIDGKVAGSGEWNSAEIIQFPFTTNVLGVHNVTIIFSDGVSASIQDTVNAITELAWYQIGPVAAVAVSGVAAIAVKKFKRKLVK